MLTSHKNAFFIPLRLHVVTLTSFPPHMVDTDGSRTRNILHAMQTLFQLSYRPVIEFRSNDAFARYRDSTRSKDRPVCYRSLTTLSSQRSTILDATNKLTCFSLQWSEEHTPPNLPHSIVLITRGLSVRWKRGWCSGPEKAGPGLVVLPWSEHHRNWAENVPFFGSSDINDFINGG